MYEVMEQVHMSDSLVASHFAAALDKIRPDLEIVVERDNVPIAILKRAEPPRRTIAEILAFLPKEPSGHLDAEFEADVNAAIDSQRDPLDAPQ
ncbi:MAG: hypothetical protein JWN34_1674 [Bryobacterales bacterium]|nr:hypothetical protein [Bryobacterales bacterium]